MRSYDDYMLMSSPWAVIRAAQHSDAAARAAVSRIIDTALEVQLDHEHVRPGWPPVSPTALAMAAASGEHIGGGYSDRDPMEVAIGRAWVGSEWHGACAWLLRQLEPRQAAAVLIQGARVRPAKAGVGNWWCKTIRELHAHQDEALRRLQLKGMGVGRFGSVRTLQQCAHDGREALLEWVLSQRDEGGRGGEKEIKKRLTTAT